MGNELKYRKSDEGRIPVPEFVLEFMTKEEFNSLPDYTRYRIRRKGSAVDLRLIEGPRRGIPDSLKGVYTDEQWASFSVYKRYHLSHPEVAEKDATKKRDKKFKDLDEWDRRQFATKLKRVFNITIEDYENLLQKQNGVCAICKQPESITYRKEVAMGEFIDTPRRLSVDHEHDTGKIRGLLCFDCNKRLHSRNGEGLKWITNAATYLEGAE